VLDQALLRPVHRFDRHVTVGFPDPIGGEAILGLKAATDLARRMVGLWRVSDELGPVSYTSASVTRSSGGRSARLSRPGS
jgi:ATP-dependent Zn protease